MTFRSSIRDGGVDKKGVDMGPKFCVGMIVSDGVQGVRTLQIHVMSDSERFACVFSGEQGASEGLLLAVPSVATPNGNHQKPRSRMVPPSALQPPRTSVLLDTAHRSCVLGKAHSSCVV